LETRKWTDKEGHDRYSTEIVLRPYSGELIMLDSRKDDDSGAHAPASNDDETPPHDEAQGEAVAPPPAKQKVKAGK
jgi:single-strand DNA-binding protein